MTTSLNMIQNQLVSISDLKKAPMTFVEKAQKSKDAVYILNNNKDVAVLLDTETYSTFLHQYQELIEEITRLNEKLTYITAEQRLRTNTTLLSDEEVRGTQATQNLSSLEDEWS